MMPLGSSQAHLNPLTLLLLGAEVSYKPIYSVGMTCFGVTESI